MPIDPELMRTHVRPQHLPEWDLARIRDSRHELLTAMHGHWAAEVISVQRIVDEIESGACPAGRS